MIHLQAFCPYCAWEVHFCQVSRQFKETLKVCYNARCQVDKIVRTCYNVRS